MNLFFNNSVPSKNPIDVVNITVVDRDGDAHNLAGKIGDNLMFMMQHNDIEIVLQHEEFQAEAKLNSNDAHAIGMQGMNPATSLAITEVIADVNATFSANTSARHPLILWPLLTSD